MVNPAAVAVALVTSAFENHQRQASMEEMANEVRQLMDGLNQAELKGVAASLAAMAMQLLPDDPEQARTLLRSMGLFMSSDG